MLVIWVLTLFLLRISGIDVNIGKESKVLVPNILHLIHLNGGEFNLATYFNFQAALTNIKPTTTMFHYIIEPHGIYWRKMVSSGQLTLTKHSNNVTIHGISPKPKDWAHKSDIIRLDVLKQYGGIYIDTDVLVIHSFDYFRQFAFTMGNWRELPLELILCNAIIVSAADSKFLDRWYESYRNVDFKCWDCQSVVWPTHVVRNTTIDIHVAKRTNFFPVDWLAKSKDILFMEGRGIDRKTGLYFAPFDGIYAQHLWNARYTKFLSGLTMQYACTSTSLY